MWWQLGAHEHGESGTLTKGSEDTLWKHGPTNTGEEHAHQQNLNPHNEAFMLRYVTVQARQTSGNYVVISRGTA